MAAVSAPTAESEIEGPTLFGHPTGLFLLFFAEMWERFSYYGMRALLLLYMMKGFLGYHDTKAYAVYGAYTSLVYMTPFLGGMIADKLLGARKAVVLGGLLMAAGHLVMTIQNEQIFMVALALLIVGNGFFKPNISTIVGSLYPEHSIQRDSGFTIFYMGINLGAALAPLLCGYIGQTYGWEYGFGLATFGMLVGLAVFVAPTIVTQALIMGAALFSAGTMVFLYLGNPYTLAVASFAALALVIAAAIATAALSRGGIPDDAGLPPHPEKLKAPLVGPLSMEWVIYLTSLIAVPLLALLVGQSTLAGILLVVFGVPAILSIAVESFRSDKIARERLWVVLILMFFSLLFWAFFEQAGSSVNNFTDRNVDRVMEGHHVSADQVGQTLELNLTQEQLGRTMGDKLITLTVLDEAREAGEAHVSWPVSEDDVGMGYAKPLSEIPASVFQSANPIYILLFGLVFTALWTNLARFGLEPSTPVKFALGLLQLGLGFGALWYGASTCDDRGMVWIGWLLIGYLLHTTGELCLSPVGLSMVTKLSPRSIVSTVMGAWFLATAFSNYLAAMIATLTGVSHGEGHEAVIPPPVDTVHIYGDVFGKIAIAAAIAALLLLLLSPVLKRWMHEED